MTSQISQPSQTAPHSNISASSSAAASSASKTSTPIAVKTYAPCARQRLCFIGLGAMGYPMAAHLVQAGHEVTVYNRSFSKAQAWREQLRLTSAAAGLCHVAASAREAAQGADIVLCCVGNDDDVRAVLLGEAGAFAGMRPGAVLVDHTTTSALLARELSAQAQTLGLAFLDAPVSGGQLGAQNGLLTVMCGGEAAAFEAARPVLLAYARSVTRMGASGAGQLTKMVNQICVAGLLQSLAEGIAFGQKAGLDMAQVLEVIGQGAAQSWQMNHRGMSMVAGQFDFGFAVDWMRKDLQLVLQQARESGAPLPVTALVDQFYADVQQMGGGRWDTSSLIQRLQPKQPL